MSVQITVSGINSQETLATLAVKVKLKPADIESDESFDLEPFLKKDLHVGSDVIDVASLQEVYPHLQPLKPLRYSYAEVEMIIGQDAFHAIRPLEYFVTDAKNAPVAVRLPLGWVLSGPLPSTSCLSSTCFRANVDNAILADPVKSWYDIESFGAYKSVDPRSKAGSRALQILESTTFHDGDRYHVGMLWAEDSCKLPNNYYSALVQLKSLEIKLNKNADLKSS